MTIPLTCKRCNEVVDSNGALAHHIRVHNDWRAKLLQRQLNLMSKLIGKEMKMSDLLRDDEIP